MHPVSNLKRFPASPVNIVTKLSALLRGFPNLFTEKKTFFSSEYCTRNN